MRAASVTKTFSLSQRIHGTFLKPGLACHNVFNGHNHHFIGFKHTDINGTKRTIRAMAHTGAQA